MKIAKVALSITLASTIALAASSDCVCFKLEGEMGKELKALIEKYHGELTQAKTESKNVEKESSSFSVFTVEEKKAITKEDRIASGKKTYEISCASCHGQKGEKPASADSMAINEMSKEDFLDAIRGYQNNDYGGSLRFSMIPYAQNVTKTEVDNMVDYLQSIK
jgi:mono/diheme cytochrome c family protein